MLRTALVVVLLGGVAAAWRLTPLSHWLEPERLAELAAPARESLAGPFAACAAILVGATLMVPVTVLIVANALVLDPVPALASAIPGVLGSAVLGYAVGRWLWHGSLDRIAGGRVDALSRALGRRGVLSIAAVRIVPVAPFTVVNLVAGASHVGLRDYVVGSTLTMVPGIVVMTLAADRLARAARDPSPERIGIAAALLVVLVVGGKLAARAIRGRARRVARAQDGDEAGGRA